MSDVLDAEGLAEAVAGMRAQKPDRSTRAGSSERRTGS